METTMWFDPYDPWQKWGYTLITLAAIGAGTLLMVVNLG